MQAHFDNGRVPANLTGVFFREAQTRKSSTRVPKMSYFDKKPSNSTSQSTRTSIIQPNWQPIQQFHLALASFLATITWHRHLAKRVNQRLSQDRSSTNRQNLWTLRRHHLKFTRHRCPMDTSLLNL